MAERNKPNSPRRKPSARSRQKPASGSGSRRSRDGGVPEGRAPEGRSDGAEPSRRERSAGAERRSSSNAILTSLQIETPLEEFRRHFQKRKRSFEGTAGGRANDVYRRAFELAEQLIRKQRGGDERC